MHFSRAGRRACPPAVSYASADEGGAILDDVAVIPGDHHEATGIPGQAQERADLAQAIGRPGYLNLIGARKLSVHGIVHGAHHPLISVGNRLADRFGKLRARSKVGLMKQYRWAP